MTLQCIYFENFKMLVVVSSQPGVGLAAARAADFKPCCSLRKSVGKLEKRP